MRYENWKALLDERCVLLRVSRRQASLDMKFSAGYLEAVEKGRFIPSRERCLKIARYFEVDPNEVLALADLYVPPKQTSLTDQIIAEVFDLTLLGQWLVLQFIRNLKLRETVFLREFQDSEKLLDLRINLPSSLNPGMSEEIKELCRQFLARLLTYMKQSK